MPTGYTDAITADMTLEQFTMRCARAFGALIMMRDDSLDAQIPEEFTPDAFYYERVETAKAKVQQVASMTIAEAADSLQDENEQRAKTLAERIQRDADTRAKYERMLAMVDAWEPPTRDHHGLKEFMQQQIRDSIKWDCREPEWYSDLYGPLEMTPAEWLARLQRNAAEDLRRAEESLAEERDGQRGRTEWVRALRGSFKNQPAQA